MTNETNILNLKVNGEWVGVPAIKGDPGDVSDVKVNGTSVVTSGVANVTVPTKTSDITNDSDFQTSTQVNTLISAYHDTTKQDTLVSGTNIKTVNNNSLLGDGNVSIDTGANTDLSNLSSTGESHFVKPSQFAEINPMIEWYVNGASGYNIWANGYCEQWGAIQPTATSLNYPVSFIKEFKDANYVITTNVANASAWSSTSSTVGGDSIVLWAGYTNRKTSEGFYFARVVADNITMWKACGYLADGEYTSSTNKALRG